MISLTPVFSHSEKRCFCLLHVTGSCLTVYRPFPNSGKLLGPQALLGHQATRCLANMSPLKEASTLREQLHQLAQLTASLVLSVREVALPWKLRPALCTEATVEELSSQHSQGFLKELPSNCLFGVLSSFPAAGLVAPCWVGGVTIQGSSCQTFSGPNENVSFPTCPLYFQK